MTAEPTRVRRVWMIGCGNMGGAMLRQWIARGTLTADAVDVVNRGDRPLPEGVRQSRGLPDGPLPDAAVLAMKPQQLDEIASQFGARLRGVPLMISILAGVDEDALSARFAAKAYVRAMPNLPVGIGKGVVALDSASAEPALRRAVADLMAPLGLVEWVAPAHFDAVTALSGSGPAFLYRFIAALAAAGVENGLPDDQAQRLALATVEGAALLASAADVGPHALAERVASPGGSTRKGLDVLDAGDALKALLTETIAAATRRNAEMAAAARGLAAQAREPRQIGLADHPLEHRPEAADRALPGARIGGRPMLPHEYQTTRAPAPRPPPTGAATAAAGRVRRCASRPDRDRPAR